MVPLWGPFVGSQLGLSPPLGTPRANILAEISQSVARLKDQDQVGEFVSFTCNSLSDCKGMQGLYGSRSYGTGNWEKNGYARAFSQLRTI